MKPGRRCVVLILDGLGDRPVPSLGGRTPLEAARTPRLDRLAVAGYCGLVDPVKEGRVPNTHTGVGVLFGLRASQRRLLHRGPVEAAGAGLALRPGDVAFRANLATLEHRDGQLFVVDRRAGRVTEDASLFAEALAEVELGEGVVARFRSTDQHRGALVLSGPGLTAALGNTDPGDGVMPSPVLSCRPKDASATRTASLVDRYIRLAHEILRDHALNSGRKRAGKLPVSGVITRGAGAAFELDGMLQARGVSAALVVGCNTVAGLGRVFDLHILREPGFTADQHTDVAGKLRAARRALESWPLVYVHIKAPDLFSHDFQPAAKRDFLESVDRALVELEECGAAIAVSADHTTDSNSGAHTADPVPALFCPPGADRSAPDGFTFGETACRESGVPRRDGHAFLEEILDYLSS